MNEGSGIEIANHVQDVVTTAKTEITETIEAVAEDLEAVKQDLEQTENNQQWTTDQMNNLQSKVWDLESKTDRILELLEAKTEQIAAPQIPTESNNPLKEVADDLENPIPEPIQKRQNKFWIV